MNSHATHESVVVATDGTPAALRGVRYATFEAQRLGLNLEILHVLPGYLPTGPLPMLADGDLQAFGHSVLEQSQAVARDTSSDVKTVSRLVSGTRVSSIVEASRNAALLVLGSRSLTLAARVWTGATVAGVSARARCPVVVVPEDWQLRDSASRLVIGFKSPQEAAVLLGRGFARARDSGAELVVLHGWKLPSAYDDIIVSRFGEAKWEEQQDTVIDGALAELRSNYPDVPVIIEVVHDRPAHALVAASQGADMLYLSRPAHGGYLHHLGVVARTVLREAHCPVEVLPPVSGNSHPPGSPQDHESIPT